MHMWRRWSTTLNLCLAFIDELGNNYLKNCWSGPIKEVRIIIFTMLYFWKEKHMEIALFYTCVPKILMMWSIVLEIECDSKNQNFEKMKKIAGDIIILHICTKNHNHNHMRYNSWDREWDRQNYLSFWAIFWPFTPLTIQKIKIFKKWKKHQMWSFYTCIPEIMIIWCMFPEIWSVTDIIFCHFGRFFCTLAILTTWIIQFFKKWKKKKKAAWR